MAKKGKGINIFKNVPKAKLNRTEFPMNHFCKFDGDFGKAYPVFNQMVLPGDTWHLSCEHFSRLMPMIAPVMHHYDVRFHWFYVPCRLVWDDFEDWMTGGNKGTWREDNPDAFPTVSFRDIYSSLDPRVSDDVAAVIRGSIWDYFGLNLKDDGLSTKTQSSAIQNTNWKMPLMKWRGYWLIYNYFFRDQNVQDELEISTESGQDSTNLFSITEQEICEAYTQTKHTYDGLFKVAWDKDYFTCASLSPQRGPQVFVPIGSSAPVTIENMPADMYVQGTYVNLKGDGSAQPDSQSLTVEDIVWNGEAGQGRLRTAEDAFSASISPSNFKGTADLSSAEGAAIDDVREAFALQRFFERMQIVGSRFAEFLRGIWGTNAGDARLQMPEYLGTWTNPFVINNVSQTSASTETSPQAGYAGNGFSSQLNAPIVKNFPEYGYLYCIYVAMPRNGYQQGLDSDLLRLDWLDWANPYFEHIGEQPIMSSQLFFDPTKDVNSDSVFGYQSQYASYKFINSHSHGELKSSLNFWHSNRIFGSQPTLSENFIFFNPDEATDRNFQLLNEPKYVTEINFKCSVERNLSAYSTPRML